MTKISAREATVKFSTTAITIDATGPIDADFTGAAETQVKDISITTPEGSVEQVAFFGETSGFQNAIIDEKNFSNAKCSGTLMIKGDEQIIGFMGGTAGTTVTGGYTRYQIGMSTATKTRVKVGAILVNLDNGSEERSFVLNNVYFTKFEIKPTGVDGHWEIAFESECLPKDYYDEFKD